MNSQQVVPRHQVRLDNSKPGVWGDRNQSTALLIFIFFFFFRVGVKSMRQHFVSRLSCLLIFIYSTMSAAALVADKLKMKKWWWISLITRSF